MKLKIENQQLQDKEVSRWWNDERTKKWHHKTYSKDYPHVDHVLLRQTKTLKYLKDLNLPSTSKVLEIGYGGGQTALKILEMGYEVHGIDVSQHFCDETKRKCQKYVNSKKAFFRVGSIEGNLPFEDNFFDAIVVLGAMQYVGNLEFCFKNISRVLKKDAHFIICQSSMYSLHSFFGIRKFILKLCYFFLNQEFVISPCFRSMLLETKLNLIFKRYENSKFMKSNFMVKGDDPWTYKIRKRLYGYFRLKKILKQFEFETLDHTNATFILSKKGFFFKTVKIIDNFLQKISEIKLFWYVGLFSDNVIFKAINKKSKNYE